MLLSPLGERLGEGVMREEIFEAPHLASLPSGGEEYEGRKSRLARFYSAGAGDLKIGTPSVRSSSASAPSVGSTFT
jgi:hypothetical protein